MEKKPEEEVEKYEVVYEKNAILKLLVSLPHESTPDVYKQLNQDQGLAEDLQNVPETPEALYQFAKNAPPSVQKAMYGRIIAMDILKKDAEKMTQEDSGSGPTGKMKRVPPARELRKVVAKGPAGSTIVKVYDGNTAEGGGLLLKNKETPVQEKLQPGKAGEESAERRDPKESERGLSGLEDTPQQKTESDMAYRL